MAFRGIICLEMRVWIGGTVTHTLALLGGAPLRTRPFAPWPVFGAAEEARLLRTLRSGHWGRLQGDHIADAFEKVHEHRDALARWARGRGAASRVRA
jgi:hypothetical protein